MVESGKVNQGRQKLLHIQNSACTFLYLLAGFPAYFWLRSIVPSHCPACLFMVTGLAANPPSVPGMAATRVKTHRPHQSCHCAENKALIFIFCSLFVLAVLFRVNLVVSVPLPCRLLLIRLGLSFTPTVFACTRGFGCFQNKPVSYLLDPRIRRPE